MPTIKDVAVLANVSISTVSNVINNKGGVSENVYQRVMAATQQLQYRPNIIARNLKKQKTRFVAVIMPSVYGHYATLLSSIQDNLERLGYYCLLKLTNDNPSIERDILHEISKMGLSGILIVPADPNGISQYEEILSWKIPVIFIERKVDNSQFSSVVYECERSAYNITLKLMEKYGENIVPVLGNLKFSGEQEYANGFRRAWEEVAGKKYKGKLIESSLNKEQAFYAIFNSITNSKQLADCYLVSNTQVAKALVEVLREINEKAYVVSMDTTDWCLGSENENKSDRNYRVAAKSTMELGLRSVELLVDYMKNIHVFENRTEIVGQDQSYSDSLNYMSHCSGKHVKVLLLESPTADSLIKQSIGFAKQYSCGVEIETLDYSKLHDRINKQMQHKKADHDIIMIDLPWINGFVERNELYDLTKLMGDDIEFLSNYPSSVIDSFMTAKPAIYGLPIMASVQVLFYRKDLFENAEIKRAFMNAHGFAMSLPTNWTEFNVLAQFFTRNINPDSPVEYGTSICGIRPVGLVDEFLPREWAFGGSWLNDHDELCFNSLNNIRALNNLKETFKLSTDENLSYWWDDEYKHLINGRFAMIQGFASHFPTPANAASIGKHYYDIGIASTPGSHPMLGGWILGINRYSEHLSEAYGFLRWAVSNHLAVQNMLLGGARPIKSTLHNSLLQTIMPWMKDMEYYLRISGKRQLIRDKTEKLIDAYTIDNVIAGPVYDALSEKVTVEDALESLNEKIIEIREQRIYKKSGVRESIP